MVGLRLLVPWAATWACLLAAASADGFNDAVVAAGTAAAQSLQAAAAANAQYRISAFDGPAATLDSLQDELTATATGGPTGPTPSKQVAGARLKLAQDLKTYLETLFAHKPEAMARIQHAWEQEQNDARNSSEWQNACLPICCTTISHPACGAVLLLLISLALAFPSFRCLLALCHLAACNHAATSVDTC